MVHEIIKITEGDFEGDLYTYVLDNSREIDPERVRPTVLICPGGGYVMTSDREAEPIAMRFLALGFNAFILRYSISPARFPTALVQLAKSVALIRDNAAKWHVNPDDISVVGFSAGGHLTGSLGVFYHEDFLTDAVSRSADEIKPNKIIMSYPVISSKDFGHSESFQTLLGDKNPEQDRLDFISLENRVSDKTPPTFIWHTYEDGIVPIKNSVVFIEALVDKGVPVEAHLYQRGVHGLGTADEETAPPNSTGYIQPQAQGWIDLAANWIKSFDKN